MLGFREVRYYFPQLKREAECYIMKRMWFVGMVLGCIHMSMPIMVKVKGGISVSGERSGDNDYCQDQWQCAPSLKHFMCDFKKNAKTENCPKIGIGVSFNDRKAILGMVNAFRNNLAARNDSIFPEGAKNMRQMTWDFELESFAGVYGSQCGSSKAPDLDPCAKTKHFPKGTRVLWGAMEKNIQEVVAGEDGWLSDIPTTDVIRSYKPVDGIERVDPNYSRFTMLAWATTHKIGCTIIKCDCSPKMVDVKKLVCFLGPAGNIGGRSVFLFGKPCDCPEGTTCKPKSIYPSLCALADDPTNLNVLSRTISVHVSNTLNLVFVILLWTVV